MQRVRAEARPGESWDEAIARLRAASSNNAVTGESELADFFISADGISAKDSRYLRTLRCFACPREKAGLVKSFAMT